LAFGDVDSEGRGLAISESASPPTEAEAYRKRVVEAAQRLLGRGCALGPALPLRTKTGGRPREGSDVRVLRDVRTQRRACSHRFRYGTLQVMSQPTEGDIIALFAAPDCPWLGEQEPHEPRLGRWGRPPGPHSIVTARAVDVSAFLAFAARHGFSGPDVERSVDAYVERVGGRRHRATVIPGLRLTNRYRRLRHLPPIQPIWSWIVPTPVAQSAGWVMWGLPGARAANRRAARRLFTDRRDLSD
jgi:hypothetical protein